MSLARTGLVAWVLCVTACAPLPERPQATGTTADSAYAARIDALSRWKGFVLTGRVAAKGAGLSGRLRWQQTGEHYEIRLAGPFGAGALAIEGDPAQAHIRAKDLDLVTDDPEATLAARTGWPLPLAALPWWVRGLPAPGETPQLVIDAAGQPISLTQHGWTLAFSDYDDRLPALPRRLVATLGAADLTVVVESLEPLP